MALEDLTGSGKFISALNPSWPVDDDWVDEGDNHIRGIKNVLKNTFPNLDGAVTLSDEALNTGLHPDGSAGAPGISWVNQPTMGLYRESASMMRFHGGTVKFTASPIVNNGGGYLIKSSGGADLNAIALGASNNFTVGSPDATRMEFHISGKTPAMTLGMNASYAQTQLILSSAGYGGAFTDYVNAPFQIHSPNPQNPGIVLLITCVVGGTWRMQTNGDYMWGNTAQGGPAGLGNAQLVVQNNGACHARSFTNAAVLASAKSGAQPLSGALASVLKLRGERFYNNETGSNDIALTLEETAQEFPELVSAPEGVPGRGINYMGLVAPLVEAIRQLEARVHILEERAGV